MVHPQRRASLRAVSQFDLEVVQIGDGPGCGEQMTSTPPVITQDAPGLEPGDHVLHTCAACTMPSPGLVAHDAVAEPLDRRASVMQGVVAVARPGATDSDDA